MNIRKLAFRLGALVLYIALAATMMVIGRGHTVYLDNKTTEYNGTEYKAYYKAVVTVKGSSPSKLYARDRGAAEWIGQNFHMDLTLTREEGGAEESYAIDLPLPYGIDGPIINLPALMNGLPQEAWLDEFIPTPVTEPVEEEVNIGDEFAVPVE